MDEIDFLKPIVMVAAITINQGITEPVSPLRTRQPMNTSAFYYNLSKPVFIDYKGDIKREISNFTQLENNWDGYGATQIGLNAVSNAIKFINVIPDVVVSKLNKEDIDITPYGTIVFEWKNSVEEILSIEIGERKIGYFSEFNDGDSPLSNGEDFNEFNIPSNLELAFSRLLRV